MRKLSPAYLEREATRLLEASMTPAERKAQARREKRNEKRSNRYQKSLAGNQWSVTK